MKKGFQDNSVTAYKGKAIKYNCEAGKPLQFDLIGQVPKKVLRSATKAWRKLNPQKDSYAFPRIKCQYHAIVLLSGWLNEKTKGVA